MGLTVAAAQPATAELKFQDGAQGQIGPYALLRRIGEGGCGIVYLAEQKVPVHRRVAIKLIQRGMDSQEVIARFQAEQQALALMDHTNIARVFDAGTTETGRPYFVMEFVGGPRITDYCDQNRLSISHRLQLFIQVCRAVQHAHQKGVIHRDLKPSNILVSEQDRMPTPKVIDFGIAKAVAQNLTVNGGITALHHFIGTPVYMSPEQAEMGGLCIDTRSDIYSLGVVLYELLTGKTPFEQAALATSGLEEMRRMIRETEPPRPSARLKTISKDELAINARHRSTDPEKLVSRLMGDPDWIVMKCLEKEPGRRYETANDLVLDVDRYLHDEPVSACPPSNFYRLQKLISRHKVAFMAGTAVAIALVAGLALSTYLFVQERSAKREQSRLRHEAEAQRARAEMNEAVSQNEAEKSRQVAKLLEDMLASVGPSAALGRDTRLLRDILDRTATSLGQELTNRPEVEMELRETLAKTYHDLSLYPQMEVMARRNLELAGFLNAHESYARSLHLIGDALMHQGSLLQAEQLHRQGLDLDLKLLGRTNLSTASALSQLATVLEREDKLGEAEKLHREALSIREEMLEDLLVADSLSNLGLVLEKKGDLPAAEQLQKQVLAMRRKLLGEDHPEVATALHNLAGVLYHKGDLGPAERTYQLALGMRRKILGEEHPAVATSLHNLARVVRDKGNLPEAERLFELSFNMRRKLLGPQHPAVSESFTALLEILGTQGNAAKIKLVSEELVNSASKTK
jgi:serine/threonine protein kinase